MFCDSCDTIEELVDLISDYICFYEDIVVPSKTVKIYPNNKPWFSKEIKQKLLSKQHLLSESNNRSLLKTTQDDINKAIEKCKLEFKTKLENQFKSNNTKEAWKGLELVTQYKPGSKSLSDDQEDLPDKLNTFYGRFDTTDNTQEIDNVKNTIHSSSDKGTITITNSDVYKHFKSLNPRKSKGPDGVSPKLLRICSQQLSPVYATIFNRCVNEHIPSIWKTATVIPVPKKSSPKELRGLPFHSQGGVRVFLEKKNCTLIFEEKKNCTLIV